VANNILDNKYGKIYSARFHYTRGLKRDGCHAIDLANWFFGKCITASKHSNFYLDDYSGSDLTIPVVAEYERCPLVTFNPCDGRKYSIFELEILTEKGKISIYESGQKIMLVKPSPDNVYGRYNSLKYGLNVTELTTQLKESLVFLYRDVYNYLTTGEDVSCTLKDALEVHRIIETIRRAD
jgi:predicted dehydrogenase